MNVVEHFAELIEMTSATISNAGWDQKSTPNSATATERAFQHSYAHLQQGAFRLNVKVAQRNARSD